MKDIDLSKLAEWWDCTREEYDADAEYIRSSQLKEFADDPKIYEARYVKKPSEIGYMGQKKQSRQMAVGTVAHAYALENLRDWQTATDCRAPLASGKRKGEPCGKAVADGGMLFDADEQVFVCKTHSKGRTCVSVPDALTPQEEAKVIGIGNAVHGSEEARDMLKDRFHERAARSVDPDTGVKKKALIDIVTPNPFVIGDMKTTEQFNPESIWRKIDENCWCLSFAHYESVIMDIQRAHGKPVHYPAWVALVVESIPPFRITDFPIDPDIQEASRDEHRTLLAEFAQCLESNKWPQRPMNTAAPQWYGYRHGMMNEGSL